MLECMCVCAEGEGLLGGCLVTRWCPTLCDPMVSLSLGFPRQEYWSGCHILL